MAGPACNIDGFLKLLSDGSPVAALGYINRGVPHRYTAVYCLAGGLLRNVLLYDKVGEVRPEFLAVVPFEHSFCQFVLRDGIFQTGDSGQDTRLDGHPYQGVMVSYSGVPVVSEAGELWGTMCHFDTVAWDLPDGDFDLLRAAARVLSPYLEVAQPDLL